MIPEHPLRQIVRELDRAGIAHMLTGSFASTYHGEEFSRRQSAEIAGTAVRIATAEDIVVAKLEWALAGESERQLRDVVGILEMRSGELDLAYVEHWVRELGLSALWKRARIEAGA